MPSIFDASAESDAICTYCKQPKTNHAPTCLYGGMDAEQMDYSTPSVQLERKWRNEATQKDLATNAHYPGRYHTPFNPASLDSCALILNKPSAGFVAGE